MRFLIVLVLVLMAAAVVTSLAMNEPGYVMLGIGVTSIELPLIDFVVLLLLVLLLLFVAVKLLSAMFSTPAKLRLRRDRNQSARSRKGLTRGLIELAAGEWQKAEKTVLQGVEKSETPLLNYLVAAHAAQYQDAAERRDEHLRKAIEADPRAEVAVGLSQAELQMRQKQYEEALATLQHLERIAPKHKFVKKQLARLFFRLKDWQRLGELLPILRKLDVLKPGELAAMELETHKANLGHAAKSGILGELHRQWAALPAELRKSTDLVAVYAELLLSAGVPAEAEKLLTAQLDAALSDELLHLLARVPLVDPVKTLTHADKWLQQQPNNPVLLAVLGRISTRARIWGKARSLLRQSVELAPATDTYLALAELYEHTRENDAALAAYKNAIKSCGAIK